MNLQEWVNERLYRGSAVVSSDFYIAPIEGRYRRNLDVAVRMDLPPVSDALKILPHLEEITGKLVGYVTAPDGSKDDSSVPLETIDEVAPGSRLMIELKGGDIEEGTVFFNWGSEKSVKYGDLINLLFPKKFVSRDFGSVIRQMRLIQCMGVSLPDLEQIYNEGLLTPDYDFVDLQVETGRGTESYPVVAVPLRQDSMFTGEFLYPFKSASNVCLVLHGSKRITFEDAIGFVNQLEDICSKFSPKVGSGEFTIPGR